MAAEFRIVSRIVYGPDMIEGVRAVIVDKDNAPRWSPADLGAVPGRSDRAPFCGFARQGTGRLT